MVDVSRLAGRPLGSVVLTHSLIFASGGSGVPLGLKSSVSGSVSGSSLSLMPTGSCRTEVAVVAQVGG